MTSVVVVESPAKAKTINKYLGSDFEVLASYGHIRDLPAKDGSVRPAEDFAMDWVVDDRSKKHIQAIKQAVKSADRLYLATDPDREGEAISWHVREVLEQDKLLAGKEVKRVVFNEITKSAVQTAFEHPRELNRELVDAYLARRALDYLVGFTLSPVLWRKLPGSRSAGRVQSVALRLICERETEIEAFRAEEYWSIEANLTTPDGKPFVAALTHLDGEKLDKMAIKNEHAAKRAVEAVEASTLSVVSVEKKTVKRNPAPPFTTSTLQQEAARKLYFSAKKTMQVAQRLYEGVSIRGETVGLITYMRTDGIDMAGEAIAAARRLIEKDYGGTYLPNSPRAYRNKAKNAQEAHEAIRPTDVFRRPKDIAHALDDDQLKLYTLIWRRTVACQMESAALDQVAVDLRSQTPNVGLRANGSVVAFEGFFRVYREGTDDFNGKDGARSGCQGDDDRDRILPPLEEGQRAAVENVTPNQHFTQPPPRYSEASLVKKLEELGIGRPSTYASIISVLQDRGYVKLEKRRFEPENRGRIVTAFLERYFPRYVEYDFTAELENELDDISAGTIDWRAVLREFWSPFFERTEEVKDQPNRDVIDAIDELLGPHFFPEHADGTSARRCPACEAGRLGLKPSRQSGFFIGCSNYPDCKFTYPLTVLTEDALREAASGSNGPRELGVDPETGEPVSVRKGPYGHYVQLGETPETPAKGKGKSKGPKPKRASIPKDIDPVTIDLDRALKLLSLPRRIGDHPETGEEIRAGLGRFGPYLLYQGNYYSLKEDDVLEVGLNRAVAIIADSPKKDPVIELGPHPDDGKPVVRKSGRWGPFVQHGRLKATLPKGTDKESVTLEQALEWLAAKAEKSPQKAAKKVAKKKTAKRKSPSRKKAAASASD
ncbi:MAG: type I DNA topoisomerase [Rhodospirillales bacterium]